ncbi:glutathione S-transferase 2-like [Anticarsia gemmatalis]|uniref:glutathione S-transferase 2-like n=1 Tax=Anticarsia gemmatalis TaxID=129554 RepID=UPI003F75F681
MPKVVYHYFPLKGLGEAPRMLLAYGGQEFEDHRISFEEWPEYKSKTLFGQIPILEIDGKLYAQSIAISRYLGRKYGLAGDDEEEAFEIDQNIDFLMDIRAKAALVYYEKDLDIKAKRHEDFLQNTYPSLLEKLNEIVERNNGHLACGKLTWGDFVLTGMFAYLKRMLQMPDLEQKYPNFKKLQDNVVTLPKVKAYIDAVPKSNFDY